MRYDARNLAEMEALGDVLAQDRVVLFFENHAPVRFRVREDRLEWHDCDEQGNVIEPPKGGTVSDAKRIDRAVEDVLKRFDRGEIIMLNSEPIGELRAAWLERNQTSLMCEKCGHPVEEKRSYIYPWCLSCYAKAAQNITGGSR